ncbi:hypothetical protein ANN_03258 [Periplaneta americana]|uniref:Uncharacterized protein n=1 Tax=Periplaneta americana TaxID=6978 RepID=A0ABQ8U1C2_PERAM|nr:hypothetical protein ANN_03258 [Periplaneta americana]
MAGLCEGGNGFSKSNLKFKVCHGSLYAVTWLVDEPREFNLPTLPQRCITYLLEKSPSKYGVHSEERPAKVPELRQQHHVERLRFAHNHANWNLEEWRRVLFTDESRFSLQMDVKGCGEKKENVFLYWIPEECKAYLRDLPHAEGEEDFPY